jgi:hypothetical protein
MDNNKYTEMHPATRKIHMVDFFLKKTAYDVFVFLDSDAWVQNGKWLHEIIKNLMQDENKHGCFSRDPYVKKNTFINSGSFIIKNNEYTKSMYSNIIRDLYENRTYHNVWPWDQYYISKYIFENRERFTIFVPDILNTPLGKVIRHNWLKNWKMYHDLSELKSLGKEHVIKDNTQYNIEEYYDHNVYPNVEELGYEYFN